MLFIFQKDKNTTKIIKLTNFNNKTPDIFIKNFSIKVIQRFKVDHIQHCTLYISIIN